MRSIGMCSVAEESLGVVDAALESLKSKSLLSKAQALQLIEDVEWSKRRKLQRSFLGTAPATSEVIGVLSSMKDSSSLLKDGFATALPLLLHYKS